MNAVPSSLSLHFFICKMGLLIAPTSQDLYEELSETMPGQLPAQRLARSRCSLNLSCDGPFQALSTPRGLGSGRSCSTAPPADSQQRAEPPGTGALSLPGQQGACPGGSTRELGVVCGGDQASGHEWLGCGHLTIQIPCFLSCRPQRSPV